MIQGKTAAAVILAAGNSTRYNPKVNKNLETIDGHPVLWYSMEAFARHPLIDEILLAAREPELPSVLELAESVCAGRKPVRAVAGGETRQESVLHCLEALESDFVLIHDGARPFLRRRYISDCLEALLRTPGVTVAVPSKDTIKLSDENGMVVQTTDRPHTWVIQTPQGFDRRILLQAHRDDRSHSATDDCMLLENAGLPVRLVRGDYTNLKITTPEDLGILQLLLHQTSFEEANQP